MTLRILTLAALATVALSCGEREEPTAPLERGAVVERVVDGDTIVLTDGRRVRLVQIDAPEAQEGECYGQEATDVLAELVPPGTAVALRTDPALDRVDRFGRLLAYVFRDETNVNLRLVQEGAASVWFFEGERGRYADRLFRAASVARNARRGLWDACPGARLDSLRAVETD